MKFSFAWLGQFTALMVAAIATSVAASNRSPFGAAWEPADCSTFGLAPLVAALSDCGYVTVPEHHSQPNGRTIQLAVVRTRSIGDNPAPDPLIMERGGPGSSTIGLFPSQLVPLTNVGTALLQQRDMVFVEQRGTQFSRPVLNCPERVDHNVAVAKGELEFSDPGWIKACRDRLVATGVNFSAFNSIENAADLLRCGRGTGLRAVQLLWRFLWDAAGTVCAGASRRAQGKTPQSDPGWGGQT